MTKTLLSGAAALAFILAAPAVYAQDADPKPAVEMDSEMADATEEAMDEASDAAEDAADDTMDAAEDTMEDAADAMDDAVDVDVNGNVSETVACPEGTEAQDDGSCMITGDWSPED